MITFERIKTWCSPDDLKEEQIHSFQPIDFMTLEIHNSLLAPTYHEEATRSVYREAMVRSMRCEMINISEFIPISFVVFLTDELGCILDLVCSSLDLQEDLDAAGLAIGVSLAKQYSGLNAVSLSMEMNCIGVVRGEEHSDSMFKDWNCVSAPLYLDGAVHGYVDISFNRGQQIEFAIPFVQQIAENVTNKWMNGDLGLQKHRLETSLNDYKLTVREKEVAYLWLMEKSALHVSTELGISEGTVRNMIKNIYVKLNVSDRWQFAKKLAN